MSGKVSIPISFNVISNLAMAKAAFEGTRPEDVVTLLQRTNESRQSEIAVAIRRESFFEFYVVSIDLMFAARAALSKSNPEAEQWATS